MGDVVQKSGSSKINKYDGLALRCIQQGEQAFHLTNKKELSLENVQDLSPALDTKLQSHLMQ